MRNHTTDEFISIGIYLPEDDPETPDYIAYCPELEGCIVQGFTMHEAMETLRQTREEYIEHLLEDNLAIPTPANTNMIVIDFSEIMDTSRRRL
jgi:predicted RNase H-like HicB family nuclease